MSTTREKALKWWNNLPYDSSNTEKSRVHYTSKYYGIDKSYSFLTGREIEEIYLKETLSLEEKEIMYNEKEVYNLLEEAMKDCHAFELEEHYAGDYRNLKQWFDKNKK